MAGWRLTCLLEGGRTQYGRYGTGECLQDYSDYPVPGPINPEGIIDHVGFVLTPVCFDTGVQFRFEKSPRRRFL